MANRICPYCKSLISESNMFCPVCERALPQEPVKAIVFEDSDEHAVDEQLMPEKPKGIVDDLSKPSVEKENAAKHIVAVPNKVNISFDTLSDKMVSEHSVEHSKVKSTSQPREQQLVFSDDVQAEDKPLAEGNTKNEAVVSIEFGPEEQVGPLHEEKKERGENENNDIVVSDVKDHEHQVDETPSEEPSVPKNLDEDDEPSQPDKTDAISSYKTDVTSHDKTDVADDNRPHREAEEEKSENKDPYSKPNPYNNPHLEPLKGNKKLIGWLLGALCVVLVVGGIFIFSINKEEKTAVADNQPQESQTVTEGSPDEQLRQTDEKGNELLAPGIIVIKKEVVIDGEGVRLRKGPGLNFEFLKLKNGGVKGPKKGEKLPFLGETEGWNKVEFEGKSYFVSKDYSHIADKK